MMKTQKKYRGMGRVEFLACREDIRALKDRGYSLCMIYDELREKGKISISRPQFNRYHRLYDGLLHKRKAQYSNGETESPKGKSSWTVGQTRAIPAIAAPRGDQDAESGDARDFNGDVSDEKRKRMTGE